MSSVTAQALEDEVSPQLRKARGAFFTPALLCDYVVDWAVRRADEKILEPSCGDAEFLVAAARRLSRLGGSVEKALHGVELHEDSSVQARARLQRNGNDAKVTVSAFFDVTPTPIFDAVVGTHRMCDTRTARGVRSLDLGPLRSEQASPSLRWRRPHCVGVVLGSVYRACSTVPSTRRANGPVVPAEFLSVNYATKVRRFLTENFREVRLVLLTERVFRRRWTPVRR